MAEVIAALRGAIEAGEPTHEGFYRVRPLVAQPHPAYDTALL
jgi:hypothetical protein